MLVTILKVLVGSRAHGLADEGSDWDYRGVFVTPTSALLSLGQRPSDTGWVEGERGPRGEKLDATAWEIGHFLALAVHCNPTILEVFRAPAEVMTPDGAALRGLLPVLWDPKRIRDAFVGYGLNQRKKMLENKDARPAKYASAYLRVLYQAHELLRAGELPIMMTGTPVEHTLRKWRAGDFTPGEVVDVCREWQGRVEGMAEGHPQRQDLGPVNAFLLDVRKRHW